MAGQPTRKMTSCRCYEQEKIVENDLFAWRCVNCLSHKQDKLNGLPVRPSVVCLMSFRVSHRDER